MLQVVYRRSLSYTPSTLLFLSFFFLFTRHWDRMSASLVFSLFNLRFSYSLRYGCSLRAPIWFSRIRLFILCDNSGTSPCGLLALRGTPSLLKVSSSCFYCIDCFRMYQIFIMYLQFIWFHVHMSTLSRLCSPASEPAPILLVARLC